MPAYTPAMKWAFWQSYFEEAGERARRMHSAWLTRALAEDRQYPRIPCRRAEEGGFGPLLDKPNGKDLAERWWSLALSRVDE